MKTINSLVLFLLFSMISQAQVWNTNSPTSQQTSGNVNIGPLTSTFPNDTKLYIRNDFNQKVGIVSEVNHSEDFKFGILSAVNRINTKAFSVMLKNGSGGFDDTFVVFGDGKVRATEVRVKTPIFPDYVFNSDYKLQDLKELELFIKENKHLPKIPTANDIIENGLQLGNMQVLQMEKIEELTLYIIELKKELDFLKNEINNLKDN